LSKLHERDLRHWQLCLDGTNNTPNRLFQIFVDEEADRSEDADDEEISLDGENPQHLILMAPFLPDELKHCQQDDGCGRKTDRGRFCLAQLSKGL